MKINNRKSDLKKRSWDFEDNFENDAARKRKKERRERFKVKNQKFHHMDYDSEELDLAA